MAGSLTHSPAHVVQRLLILLGVGTDPTLATLGAWPVYEDQEPGSPDNVLTVYNTSPRVHGRVHTDGETQQHWGIQIRIRGTTAPITWLKANGVVTALDGQYQDRVTISGTSYDVHAVHHSGVIRLGKDNPTTKRSLFTINALAGIRRVT